jgi:pilus assembly protein Flp/PilA
MGSAAPGRDGGMDTLIQKVKAVWESQEGQGLVEYSLILVLVSIVAIAALGLIGGNVANILNTVANHLNPVH